MSSYPPLTQRLIGAVNSQYRGEYSFSISSASVPADQVAAAKSAVKVVVGHCNGGKGTWIVAVGTVRTNISKRAILAVFTNPPGQHLPISTGSLAPEAHRLNWYAIFVTSLTQPFCTFGYSPRLPALPIH